MCISYCVVVVCESDIPQPSSLAAAPPSTPPIRSPHTHALTELLIPFWSLVLGIASQHALNAHAHAFDALDRGPSGGTE